MSLKYSKKLQIALSLLSTILLGFYGYCAWQSSTYRHQRDNHLENTQTINAKLIDLKKTVVHESLIRYDSKMEYFNPFTKNTETATNVNICEITEPPNYCEILFKNMTTPSTISVYLTKQPFKDTPFRIDILKKDDIYHLESIRWRFMEITMLMAIIIITIPITLKYFDDSTISNEQNSQMRFALLLFYWLICLVSFGCLYSHYTINYHKWQYVKEDMTVKFVIKTNLTTYSNTGNLTRYDIFYQPSSTFQMHHGDMIQESVVHCPNSNFRYHRKDNYDKCVQHHDKYYKQGSLVSAYISKIHPYDIQIAKPITFHDKIIDVIRPITLVLWVIAIFSILVFATNNIVKKLKKN